MSILVRTLRSLAVAVICAALPPSVADARTWTNTDGETMEAEFSSLRDGRTVLLRTDDKTIRAPLAKLSDADRQWVKDHKKISRSRDWGATNGPQYKGKFVSIRNGKVRVQQGSKLSLISFDELSQEDWSYVERLHEHLGTELPGKFVAARPLPQAAPTKLATGPPAEGTQRDWIDAKGRKITAIFVGTREKNVLLWMRDREFAVPIDRLSQADRTWVAQHNLSQLSSKLGSGLSSVAGLWQAGTSANPPANPPPGPIPDSRFQRGRPPTPVPDNRFAKPFVEEITEVEEAVEEAEEVLVSEIKAPTNALVNSNTLDSADEELRKIPARRIDHIDELSEEEFDERLEEAFGNEEVIGIAECTHCEAGFGYTEDFVEGSPCPFCQTAVTELVSMEEFAEEMSLSFGSSRPWYLRRGFRRVFFFVLIGGVGLLAKAFANSAA